jgi:hypothetical protein
MAEWPKMGNSSMVKMAAPAKQAWSSTNPQKQEIPCKIIALHMQ